VSPSPTRDTARADVWTAIANPLRRQILDELQAGPVAVRDLARRFDVTRPAVSQHLTILLAADLVSEERVGRERRYRLEAAPLREVQGWLGHYEQFWSERLHRLRDVLDRES
jgi:DNA-binding transcriptional ArsR family regulator